MTGQFLQDLVHDGGERKKNWAIPGEQQGLPFQTQISLNGFPEVLEEITDHYNHNERKIYTAASAKTRQQRFPTVIFQLLAPHIRLIISLVCPLRTSFFNVILT